MSEIGAEELEARLRRCREAVESLGPSRRKARIVSIVGTICGFVVVGIFVWLFLSPFLKLKDPAEQQRLIKAAQNRLQELGVEREAKATAEKAWSTLSPIYRDKIKAELEESELLKKATKEARTLADDVVPVYFKALKAKIEALDLGSLAREEMERVINAVWPTYSAILQEKLQESELGELAMEEVRKASGEVWSVYHELIGNKVEEMGVLDDVEKALQEVIDEAGPAYSAEFDRIRPRLLTAFESEGNTLLDELRVLTKDKVETALTESILKQEDRLLKDLELSEPEIELMLGTLVEASHRAVSRMVEKRADTHRKLLAEIEAMLPEVGMAEEHDLDVVVDQMLKVLVLLLKHKLPEEFEDLPLD